MKKPVGVVILLVVFLTASCAYFNTFYNAKYYYGRAYHETRKNPLSKTSAAEKTNYNKAIEKAIKLIDMYPKSKYVDDALLLMGKSYYYLEEYLNAQRRLMQIKEDFPESELIGQADLWLAKTELALERFDEAREKFETLLNSNVSKKTRAEAHFYLAKLYQEQGAFDKAVQMYQKSDEIGLEGRKAETMYAVAANYDSLRIYDKAADFYSRVVKVDPTLELRYEAEFKYALMQKKQRRFDEAIRLFERLLGEEAYKAHIPELRLEIADCLMRRGDMKDAILTYRDIAQEHKKSQYSARAYYMLGKIHEEYKKDYTRALDAFTEVQREYRQSEVADSADTKKRDIQRLMALKRVVEMVQTGEEGEIVLVKEEAQEDSLTDNALYAMIDSANVDTLRQRLLLRLGGEIFLDSVMSAQSASGIGDPARSMDDIRRFSNTNRRQGEEENVRMDWKKWIDNGEVHRDLELLDELRKLDNRRRVLDEKRITENPELKSFNPEEIDRNLFLLAELYLFRFSMPDSAVRQYNRIVEEFPKSVFAPRALYNMGYVEGTIKENSEEERRLLRRLVETNPNSIYTIKAKEKLGLSAEQVEQDSVEVLFREAETFLLERQDPAAAMRKYGELWEKYPDSEFAPKAAYAMAWISEYRLDTLDLAFTLYDSLLKQYPETAFARTVKGKVDIFKAEKQKEKQERIITASTDSAAAAIPAETSVKPEAGETSSNVISPVPEEDTSKEPESKVSPETEVVTEIPAESPEKVADQKEAQHDTVESKADVQEAVRDTVPQVVSGGQEVDESASLVGGMGPIQEKIATLGEIMQSSKTNVVSVRVQIDENGAVKAVEIKTTTGNPALDGAIREIVRSAEYLPARKDGVPVLSWTTLSIPLITE